MPTLRDTLRTKPAPQPCHHSGIHSEQNQLPSRANTPEHTQNKTSSPAVPALHTQNKTSSPAVSPLRDTLRTKPAPQPCLHSGIQSEQNQLLSRVTTPGYTQNKTSSPAVPALHTQNKTSSPAVSPLRDTLRTKPTPQLCHPARALRFSPLRRRSAGRLRLTVVDHLGLGVLDADAAAVGTEHEALQHGHGHGCVAGVLVLDERHWRAALGQHPQPGEAGQTVRGAGRRSVSCRAMQLQGDCDNVSLSSTAGVAGTFQYNSDQQQCHAVLLCYT